MRIFQVLINYGVDRCVENTNMGELHWSTLYSWCSGSETNPFPSLHPVDGDPGVQAVLKCDGTWPEDQFPNCSCIPAVRDMQRYDRMTSALTETPSCRLQQEQNQTQARQAAAVKGPWLQPAGGNLTLTNLNLTIGTYLNKSN